MLFTDRRLLRAGSENPSSVLTFSDIIPGVEWWIFCVYWEYFLLQWGKES